MASGGLWRLNGAGGRVLVALPVVLAGWRAGLGERGSRCLEVGMGRPRGLDGQMVRMGSALGQGGSVTTWRSVLGGLIGRFAGNPLPQPINELSPTPRSQWGQAASLPHVILIPHDNRYRRDCEGGGGLGYCLSESVNARGTLSGDLAHAIHSLIRRNRKRHYHRQVSQPNSKRHCQAGQGKCDRNRPDTSPCYESHHYERNRRCGQSTPVRASCHPFGNHSAYLKPSKQAR